MNTNLTVPLGIAAEIVLPRKTVKQTRGYDIGERNPAKLDVDAFDASRSAYWSARRKLASGTALVGSKY